MIRNSILFGVLLLLFSASAFPQTPAPGTTEKSPVQLQNEPHHHLKLQNNFVRIWDTMIPAGEATLWHVHSNDNVVLTMNDAKVRVETVGAQPNELQAKLGDVAFRKAPYVHRTMSVGATPFHNMAIEILTAAGKSELLEQKGPAPVIDNDRVRVYRISLPPGQLLEMQTILPQSVEIIIQPSMIETLKKDASAAESKNFDAGEIIWHDLPLERSIKNIGTTDFEVVEIELK